MFLNTRNTLKMFTTFSDSWHCSYHNNAFLACRALYIAKKLNASSVYPLLELFFKNQVWRISFYVKLTSSWGVIFPFLDCIDWFKSKGTGLHWLAQQGVVPCHIRAYMGTTCMLLAWYQCYFFLERTSKNYFSYEDHRTYWFLYLSFAVCM